MKLKLAEKKQETSDVTTFVFSVSEPLTWEGGVYLHYVLHHRPTDDRGSDRWFTISSAPFEKNPTITTRFSGEKSSSFKKKLFAMAIGEEIEVAASEGDFTFDNSAQEHVFIAGGIGITPFRSMLKQLDHDKKPIHVTLLYANRDQDIVFQQELEAIASRNSDFKIHYIFSPEHIDEKKIREFITDIQKPVFYVSGPEPMVENLGNVLKEMGITENHIKQDWFPGYPEE